MSRSPLASVPICLSEAIIEVAKAGPLTSSHQKKPIKTVKRINSAKNSPISARRNAIRPKVQTMLIMASSQNSQDARSVITLAQAVAAV